MSVGSEGCRWGVTGIGGELGLLLRSEGCRWRVRGVGGE